jgi:DNA-binding response OmpR family regulator
VKILIVDDEAHIRQMMRLTLEAAGYQVEEAGDGASGLALFGDGRDVAVVLLDQKMPGIDGLETLRQIKARVPEACVVMVTAFASIELAVDAMRLGATDFLQKPMTPEMLRSAVAATTAKRPRTPVRPAGVADAHPSSKIENLTLNGFHVVRPDVALEPATGEHPFDVTHYPDRVTTRVVVRIDPEAVARVERLTRRHLKPGGSFWRAQAEHLLSAYLWSEGRIPDAGLTVHDVSRDAIDVAAAWELDETPQSTVPRRTTIPTVK